jgi:hypothetical protein
MAQHKSKFKVGDQGWLWCEVRPGPFPNERRVYVKVGDSEWFGFVGISQLENKLVEGKDRVRAAIVAVHPNEIVLGLRGQSPASRPIQTTPSLIAEYGSFAT